MAIKKYLAVFQDIANLNGDFYQKFIRKIDSLKNYNPYKDYYRTCWDESLGKTREASYLFKENILFSYRSKKPEKSNSTLVKALIDCPDKNHEILKKLQDMLSKAGFEERPNLIYDDPYIDW